MTPLPLAACLLIVILGGLPILARADATVWFENSTTKVFRDDPPGETKVARLTSAANEVESVQIVVRAHEGPLRNVMVRVSDLVRDKGARIPADAVELFRVAYVHLPAHSRDFPDALPPWTGCDIAAGENQPVWADIHIPADTPPGAYRATVTVQADGVPAEALALELTVWSFALPETPRSRSAFGLHGQPVAQQHGVEVGSPAYDSLMDKYRELLVAHRAMPTSPGRPLESDETARYLDDPRVCAFSLPYSDDDAMLKRQAAYVRAKGWIDKAFFYVVDEPWNKGHYDLLRERAAKIHAADPDLKIVTPYFREPDF